MAQKFGRLVEENLNVGTGLLWVTAPGGGKLRATQVGLHTFARGKQAYTATWAPGSIAAGDSDSVTLTVPDATTADFVLASHDKILTSDLRIVGNVSAANTAQVVIHNPTSAAVTVASGTVSVIVFPSIGVNTDVLLTAEFTSAPVEGGIVDEGIVGFTDATTNGTAPYTYSWDFGDGSGTSTDQNPQYTYNRNGGANPQTFTVTLTVTDDVLDTDPVSHDVTVSFNT